MNKKSGKKFEEIFDAFVVAKTAKGVSDVTIRNYHQNLHNISLRFDISMPFEDLKKEHLDQKVMIPNMKDKDTVKETYTDEELEMLLKKPDKNCDFCEYRSWAIVNFLLNSVCRAATVRNIQNRDVDLHARHITLRHTKTGKIQVIPLCSLMASILRDYMAFRGGESADYLFCDQFGGMLSECALRQSIAKYNQRRGVQKTSIHLFRHSDRL